MIPQPDKYRPPSHGRRNPRSETLQKSYGAPLTLKEKEEMRRKKYPNMMAAEDTIIHWFLHNQTIHVFISMVGASSNYNGNTEH